MSPVETAKKLESGSVLRWLLHGWDLREHRCARRTAADGRARRRIFGQRQSHLWCVPVTLSLSLPPPCPGAGVADAPDLSLKEALDMGGLAGCGLTPKQINAVNFCANFAMKNLKMQDGLGGLTDQQGAVSQGRGWVCARACVHTVGACREHLCADMNRSSFFT